MYGFNSNYEVKYVIDIDQRVDTAATDINAHYPKLIQTTIESGQK